MEPRLSQPKTFHPMAEQAPGLIIILLLGMSGIYVSIKFGRDSSLGAVIPLGLVLAEFLLAVVIALVFTVPYKITITDENASSTSILSQYQVDFRNWFVVVTPDSKWRRVRKTYLFSPGKLIPLPNQLDDGIVNLKNASGGNFSRVCYGGLVTSSCRNYSRLRLLNWLRCYGLLAAAGTSLCLFALASGLGLSIGFIAGLTGLIIASGGFLMLIAEDVFTHDVLRLGTRCGDLEFIVDWVYTGSKGIEDQIGSIMVRNIVGVDPYLDGDHRIVGRINKLIQKYPTSTTVRSLMPILGALGDRETLRMLMYMRSSKFITADVQYLYNISEVISAINSRH